MQKMAHFILFPQFANPIIQGYLQLPVWYLYFPEILHISVFLHSKTEELKFA